MLKKEMDILKGIVRENNESVLSSNKWLGTLYELEDFTFASSGVRFLGQGTIPDNIEGASKILKDIFVKVNPQQAVAINPKEMLKSIKEWLKSKDLNVKDTKGVVAIISFDKKSFTIQIKTKLSISVTSHAETIIATFDNADRTIYYSENVVGERLEYLHDPIGLTIGFNLRYLIDALEFLNCDYCRLGFNSVVYPILISQTGNFGCIEQKKFGVILPIRMLED